jgi:hypothetical protein
MQTSPEDLLKMYLGQRTGERVLAGQTKRGEGEKIHAVIWLCDLRDSTRLSETIPMEDFFRSLNEFFDCTAGAVLEHGGEILSYSVMPCLPSSQLVKQRGRLLKPAFAKKAPAQPPWQRLEMLGRGWTL